MFYPEHTWIPKETPCNPLFFLPCRKAFSRRRRRRHRFPASSTESTLLFPSLPYKDSLPSLVLDNAAVPLIPLDLRIIVADAHLSFQSNPRKRAFVWAERFWLACTFKLLLWTSGTAASPFRSQEYVCFLFVVCCRSAHSEPIYALSTLWLAIVNLCRHVFPICRIPTSGKPTDQLVCQPLGDRKALLCSSTVPPLHHH